MGRAETPATTKQAARTALQALATVESAANEWGTVALSEMVLIKNEHQFNLGYTNTTADYIARARTQTSGAARESLQTAFYGGMALTANLAPPVSAGRPAGSNALPVASPETPSLPANAGALLPSQFTPGLTVPTDALSGSERNALRQGVNDKITELLFGQFADPGSVGEDKAIVFGVIQVTCQPGWRTANSYVADLNVRVDYARRCSNGIESDDGLGKVAITSNPGLMSVGLGHSGPRKAPDGACWETGVANPGVYAVLPLVDSVNFNLADSRRKQLEIATSLAALFAAQGLTGQAQLLTDYVRRQESDLSTRTVLPTVTSYSDGASFGFRIYPLPQAVRDPGTAYGGRGNVLQPVTFPAVVALVLQKSDLELEGKKPWTHYSVSVRPRWIPTKAPLGPMGRAIRWLSPGYTGGNHRKAFGPERLMEVATQLDSATDALEGKTDPNSHVLGQARRTLSALDGTLAGSGRLHELPKPWELGFAENPNPPARPVALASFQPLSVIKNSRQAFIISAKGFKDSGDPRIIIAGQEATVQSLANDGKTLVCRAEVTLPPLTGKHGLGVVMTLGTQLAAANYEVEFMPAEKAEPPAAKLSTKAELRFKGTAPVTIEVPVP